MIIDVLPTENRMIPVPGSCAPSPALRGFTPFHLPMESSPNKLFRRTLSSPAAIRGAAFLLTATVGLLALFACNPKANAAVSTWVGSSGTSDWATAADWGGTALASGNSIIFTSTNNSTTTPANTITDDEAAGWTVAGITFNSGALAYTLTGNSFALTGGITNSSTNLETINDAMTMTGVQTITMTAGGGNVTLAGNISGAGGFTTATSGTLTLSGSNSYAGLTTVGASTTLQLQANAGNTVSGTSYALGANSLTMSGVNASTSTLQLRSDTSLTFNGGNSMGGLGGTSAGETVDIDVNQLTATGSNNTLTFAPGGFATFDTTFNITGGNGYALAIGPITTGNVGTLTLNANSANLIINGGITDVTTLTFGGGFNSSVTGAITNGATTTALTKSGAGTLTLSGADAYTGATNVTAGTIKIGNLTALGVSQVNVTAGATIDLNGNNLAVNFINNGAALAGGTVDNVSAGGNITLTVGGGTGGNSSATSSNYTSADLFSGVIANTTGTVGLTKVSPIVADQSVGIMATASLPNGGDLLALSNVNTYTGATTVDGGMLELLFDQSNNGGTAVTSNIISSSSALVLAGGDLIVDQTAGTVSQTFASTTLNAGASHLAAYRASSSAATLFLGAITRNVGSSVDFQSGKYSGSSNAHIGAADGTDETKTANALFTGGQASILGGYATFNENSWAVSAGNGTTEGAITSLGTYSTTFTAATDVDTGD